MCQHQGVRAAHRLFRGHGADFGGLVWFFAGSKPAIEFYSGWLTEYSLSIDNLFVFVIIMSNFAVPKVLQKYVLSVGITVALILRGCFILVGAAIIQRFTWVFFLFGAFLIYTAIKLVVGGDDDEEYHENGLIRMLRKVIRITTIMTVRSCAPRRTASRTGLRC